MESYQDFVMLKNGTEKWIALSKYCMVLDFKFSLTVGT